MLSDHFFDTSIIEVYKLICSVCLCISPLCAGRFPTGTCSAACVPAATIFVNAPSRCVESVRVRALLLPAAAAPGRVPGHRRRICGPAAARDRKRDESDRPDQALLAAASKRKSPCKNNFLPPWYLRVCALASRRKYWTPPPFSACS